MAKTGTKAKSWTDRFWPKVEKRGPEECWLWKAGKNGDGYGTFTGPGSKSFTAHRTSWFLAHGFWPDLHVLHRCDIRNCVNPAHLFLGTQKDNVADMFAKGRDSYGEGHPISKITEAAARDIRNAPGSGECVGSRFGISASQVYRIRNGKSWQHLAETG